jgi:hypothetical protein
MTLDKVNDQQRHGDQIGSAGDSNGDSRRSFMNDIFDPAAIEALNGWNRTVGAEDTFKKEQVNDKTMSFSDAYLTLQSTQKGGMMGGHDAGRDANEERKLGGSALNFSGDIYGISDTAAKGADDAFQQMLDRNRKAA